MKRLIDPKIASPNLWLIEGRVAGVTEAAAKAKKDNRFDYAARIPGIEVVDRYTLRLRLEKPDYSFLYILAMSSIGAQAREVVEKYGVDIGAHPIGTGPFRLAQWRRASKIVLEKNPNFREEYYEAEPPADDPVAQRLYAEMKGKRIPQLDRVEIYDLVESQPRWLAFLNKELDWINLPLEFANMALPEGRLAPWLEKRGVKYFASIDPDLVYLYFDMRDPVFGGYTPDKVALRRALSLAYDIDEDVNLVRNGTAVAARGVLPPACWGTTPISRSASATTLPGRRRSSTCSATWTGMVTAGASARTARPSCSSTRRSPTHRRGSSPSCGRRTWMPSGCG
jgi:ABC-type transport system substrate-binding protein